MNHYLITICPASPSRPLPSWQAGLSARGIALMPLRTLPEALQYSRVYPTLLILMDLRGQEEGAAEPEPALPEGMDTAGAPPLLALTDTRPDTATLERLAAVGFQGVISQDDPEPFMLWRLDQLRQLAALRAFEQSRMDVAELAKKTRIHLHDISQPLSAMQGRLQLMAARCPDGDPNAAVYNDLVQLSFKMTQQLMELQRLHRQVS